MQVLKATSTGLTRSIVGATDVAVNGLDAVGHLVCVLKRTAIQEHKDAYIDGRLSSEASIQSGIKAGIDEAELREAFSAIENLTPFRY